MKIVGLRIEKYIGESVSGHNCDFEYVDTEFERHVLFGILEDKRKVKITLWEEQGECGSGWCSASWGKVEVEEIEKFEGYTYTTKEQIYIDDILPESYNSEYINNKVFEVSYDGGDSYYPCGDYTVNMDLFTQTIRHKEKRPVWVFKGSSNRGKSFIASHLVGLTVYETDSNANIPFITEDIVVLGNKYTHQLQDIEANIFGDYELHVVDFY
ncbi:hypothetical protein [Paenibacillus donghaensis]|uniref:Uncharacterized protein n=1 Tax=Paenibacillus donghaensis TaxID=414771 RepID=A0A2Z2KAT9_9BACL|nr:hypothetical protein [Paenibacillus donghaensis]ASA22617.1 hypothetical protein B9T62_18595 [Paenibacillus donghaensis]